MRYWTTTLSSRRRPLESLEPAERHRVYRMLKLRVIVESDVSVEVNGAFGGALSIGELEPS